MAVEHSGCYSWRHVRSWLWKLLTVKPIRFVLHYFKMKVTATILIYIYIYIYGGGGRVAQSV